jgi:hypothetical protein
VVFHCYYLFRSNPRIPECEQLEGECSLHKVAIEYDLVACWDALLNAQKMAKTQEEPTRDEKYCTCLSIQFNLFNYFPNTGISASNVCLQFGSFVVVVVKLFNNFFSFLLFFVRRLSRLPLPVPRHKRQQRIMQLLISISD